MSCNLQHQPRSPSFARSTASSRSRRSPKVPKTSKAFTRPPFPPLIKRKGHHNPPGRKCYFLTLPSELRIPIYRYVLNTILTIHISPWRESRGPLFWPPLLRVYRVIRTEASYEFYSKTAFSAGISQNNFGHIMRWADEIPLDHRVHLHHNCHLTLDLHFREIPNFLPMPHRYSNIDKDAWAESRLLGNIYEVSNRHRHDFVCLGRLVTWFLWCAKPIQYGISWSYQVSYHNSFGSPMRSKLDRFAEALKQTLGLLRQSNLLINQLNATQKQLLTKEALNMLSNFDNLRQKRGIKAGNRWTSDVAQTKKILSRWQRRQ